MTESDTETYDVGEEVSVRNPWVLSRNPWVLSHTVTFVSFLHSGGQLSGASVVRRHGRPCQGSSYLVRV